MLVLVWLLILMVMRMMKSEEIITACSGEAVLLTSDLLRAEQRRDVRWTHPQLMMSQKNNRTKCDDGRCELLKNGSLSFSQVQAADSGNYDLQVFDEGGKVLGKTSFLLQVNDTSSCSSNNNNSSTSSSNNNNNSTSSSNNVLVSSLTCFFLLLLLLFIIFIVLRRRRSQRTCTATDSLQENVYVTMHGHHGNRKKEEEGQEKEEESHYVAFNPMVSMETPITQQVSKDVEDIYV